MIDRKKSLQLWVNEQAKLLKGDHVTAGELEMISGDASFRQYYRLTVNNSTLIAVDAPPETEDNPAFVAIAEALLRAGISAPLPHAYDMKQGFLLLSDLGDQQLLGLLNQDSVDTYYHKAIQSLILMQKIPASDYRHSNTDSTENGWSFSCPDYDHKRLHDEMHLFSNWFLPRYLELHLDSTDCETLTRTYEILAQSALEQPGVFVHRDYHSRNIMVLGDGQLSMIDFQDGVMGPITYDLVSLLKDCYVSWPVEQVQKWAEDYRKEAVKAGLLTENAGNEEFSKAQFFKWFDWMGVQRHLKAIGIFARLNIRDGKPGYLKDIPRTFNYILEVGRRYPELEPLHRFLVNKVLPELMKVNPDAGEFINQDYLL